jgi:hypothetical protein
LLQAGKKVRQGSGEGDGEESRLQGEGYEEGTIKTESRTGADDDVGTSGDEGKTGKRGRRGRRIKVAGRGVRVGTIITESRTGMDDGGRRW